MRKRCHKCGIFHKYKDTFSVSVSGADFIKNYHVCEDCLPEIHKPKNAVRTVSNYEEVDYIPVYDTEKVISNSNSFFNPFKIKECSFCGLRFPNSFTWKNIDWVTTEVSKPRYPADICPLATNYSDNPEEEPCLDFFTNLVCPNCMKKRNIGVQNLDD